MLHRRLPFTDFNHLVSLPITSQTPRFLAMKRLLNGPIKYHIVLTTANAVMSQDPGYDFTQPLRPVGWLTIPAHSLDVIAWVLGLAIRKASNTSYML